jgi:hypothetical protein
MMDDFGPIIKDWKYYSFWTVLGLSYVAFSLWRDARNKKR